jgi:FAD/FMN-containing dehydrogenase
MNEATSSDGLIRPGAHWRNWVGNQAFTPAYVAQPRSEADVLTVLRFARDNGLAVRAQGAKHSWTAIVPTSGVLVDFDAFNDVVALDRAARQITVRPGMRIKALTGILRANGMSLANQGDIDSQAIAGAVMTATHGAGRRLACMSTQVVAMRIATAAGEILDLSAQSEPEVFRAARVSLGMLGLVLSLTIQAVPAYNILKRSWNMDVEDCIAQLPVLLQRHRTCYHLWLPRLESAALYELPLEGIDSTATRTHDICQMRSYDAFPEAEPAPRLGRGEQYGHSAEIFPNEYEPNYHELEYAVPFDRALDAFAEVRERILSRHPAAFFPVECRAVAADDSYLSPYAGRDGFAISVSQSPATDYWSFLQDMDEVLARYEGRPHWAKLHFMTPARLERLFPLYGAFKELRRRLDPEGVFLNDMLRPLFL